METGWLKTMMIDAYYNLKNYKGDRNLPIRLSYLHMGHKFQHEVDFYMINLHMNTSFSDDYLDYDYCEYSGGELTYRLFYNMGYYKNFGFSMGSGISSHGTNRNYYYRWTGYGPLQYRFSDITSASLLLNARLSYTYQNSFVLVQCDVPLINYFQRPAEQNDLRHDTQLKWYAGSLGEYMGLQVQASLYQQLYKGFFLNLSGCMHYYQIKTNYLLKSYTAMFTLGISYNF